MLKKIRQNYSTRVFSTFLIFSLILLIGTSVVSNVFFYKLYQQNLREQSAAMVGNLSMVMSSTIEDYTTAMEMIQKEESLKRYFNGTITEDTKLEVIKQLYFMKNSFAEKAEISVIELHHNSWLSTTNQESYIAKMIDSGWGIFRRANDTKNVAVYAFAKDAVLNSEDRICLAKACRTQEGKTLGYILVELPRTTLEKMVAEYSSYNAALMMVNQNGTVVFHSEGQNQEGLGKIEGYGKLEELRNAKNGEYVWGHFISTYNKETNLYIISELPAGAMTVILQTIIYTILISILLIVILASVFSRLVAKSVAHPIQNLEATMAIMEKGDLSARVEIDREDEIGHLGRSFNTMADEIEMLMKNIDEEKHSLWIAETKSLNLQMNPHFLYNTLDLIKWNAKLGRTQEIADIAVQLGRLLRRVMNTREDLVSVSYEMEIITAFVEIQKKHYGEQLRLLTEIEPGTEEMLIPKLTLQPIVENAIVHGFEKKAESCCICIKIKKQDPYLKLEVEDNGDGMTKEQLDQALEFKQENTHHIGLNNVQRRARLYGDEHCGLTISSTSGIGTTVCLTLKQME